MKLFDGHGLHLYVTPTGFKSWRLKYRFGGKEKQLTLGPYPKVTLKEARLKREDALRMLRDGLDPGNKAKAIRERRSAPTPEETTFRAAAKRWLARQDGRWRPNHAKKVARSLEVDVYPRLGSLPLTAIKPSDVRSVIEAIQARGTEGTAHQVLGRISAIFDLAVVTEQATSNPAQAIRAILRPVRKQAYPALTNLAQAQSLLKELAVQPSQPSTRMASFLLALTAARPGMVRMAEIPEFHGLDGPEPVWVVPARKMKLALAEAEREDFEFVLPLSRQSAELVKLAIGEWGSQRQYLFPSIRFSHRPISDATLSVTYLRSKFAGRHVPHGWRSTFSTIMNERASELGRPGDRAVIDLMLAHKPQGVEAIYNRAAYMPRRRELAQEWADLLMDGMPHFKVLREGPRH